MFPKHSIAENQLHEIKKRWYHTLPEWYLMLPHQLAGRFVNLSKLSTLNIRQ